tara:strand:- start:5814 stop:5957 length:144 start_codon:yes stop_codon:yes gene_type:complete
MRYYSLDALAMVRGIEDLLGQDFGITEDDLDTARIEDVHSLTKAEAL